MNELKQVFDQTFEMLKSPWVSNLFLIVIALGVSSAFLRCIKRVFISSVHPIHEMSKTVKVSDISPDSSEVGCSFVCSDTSCTWNGNPAGQKWCLGCNRRGLCSFCASDCSKRSGVSK